MQTHSPTPWRIVADPQGRCDIVDANGDQVAMLSDNGWDVANAQLIVRSVNAATELLRLASAAAAKAAIMAGVEIK